MDDALRKLIDAVKAKRPRTVLDHILEYGQITTEELRDLYGYNHPPRAARDVKDCGIPLEMTRVVGKDGRKIAVYRLGKLSAGDKVKSGRKPISKALKSALVARDGERCAFCGGRFPSRALQVDHRVPYEIAGESLGDDPSVFLLACGSCNRAKSWSCEECPNWIKKDSATCQACLWASPSSHTHVATSNMRRLDISWVGEETAIYEGLAANAGRAGEDIRELVKQIIERAIRRNS